MIWDLPRLTDRVVAVVMAGGAGRRLLPLTSHRSKPSVPFGGQYRIIDFVLSNLVNSGIDRIYVLTQYKAQSLLEHLHKGWINLSARDSFLVAVPAQMQDGASWYRGTADAIYQNLGLLQRCHHEIVAVFGADHVYKMDVGQMVKFHMDCNAAVTVACLAVPRREAVDFGVVEVDASGRILSFREKPTDPAPLPGHPDTALVSMGNYLFRSELLREALRDDAADAVSTHDFGKVILPRLVQSEPVFAYDFHRNRIPWETAHEAAYWRDLGTVEAYYEANLDLKNVEPQLNMYNWHWPIRTVGHDDPPVKFVFDEVGRRGTAVQSIVSGGCILAGGYVKDSVLGRHVFVDAGAEVTDSVLFDNVHVGPGARVHRAIVDKNVEIPAGARIDAQNFHRDSGQVVTTSGIVVVPRASDSPENRARSF